MGHDASGRVSNGKMQEILQCMEHYKKSCGNCQDGEHKSMSLQNKLLDSQKVLLLATNNAHKVHELQQLLQPLVGVRIITPADIGLELEVAENGPTYRENALLKARAYNLKSGLITLADDSGLEVDALDGAPGLYSKRFGGLHGLAQLEYLLEQIKYVPEAGRGARFRAVVVIYGSDNSSLTFEGVCEGRIGYKPEGENGFGYDPIFILPERGQTMAQLSDEDKNQISHRARAIQKALPALLQLFR
jgi:XTP/dITP diphosphohydrolase